MASKEEIERRVQDEAEKALDRWEGETVRIWSRPTVDMQNAVRPLVERVIELEEEAGELRERLDQHAPKLTAAEARGDDLAAALHNMTRERDELGAAMVCEGEEGAGLTEKLAQAEARAIELDRQVQAINADRSRVMADCTAAMDGAKRLAADLGEARADLRTATRELGEERTAHRNVLLGRTNAENTIVEMRTGLAAERRQAEIANGVIEHERRTAEALRAQVAALSAVIDGHEQAIRDTAADVRGQMRREVDFWTSRATVAEDQRTSLETTVDVLAGRLAARTGG